MSSIRCGDQVPDFELPSLSGQRVALRPAVLKGPVILAFYKVSCPVCQLAFPFLERLHLHYAPRLSVLGISQDDPEATHEFCRDFGITFPALLDEPGYPVSNAFGLTNVPTVYLLSSSGIVESCCIGFDKAVFEEINARLAERLRAIPAELFRPGELVPDFQPG